MYVCACVRVNALGAFVNVCENFFDSIRYLLRGLPVAGIVGYAHLVPWLEAFERLTFAEQVSLAGNGQSLPLCGSITILALVGVSLKA